MLNENPAIEHMTGEVQKVSSMDAAFRALDLWKSRLRKWILTSGILI